MSESKATTSVLKAILWPPLAPLGHDSGRSGREWWRAVCIASVIPIAAILHNRVFWTSTCMLNPFGADYTPSVVHDWLLRDPSLPWAIVLCVLAWSVGRIYPSIKLLVAPIFASFLPLSVWLWDIPFTGRYICHHFHDNRVQFAPGMPLSSKDFYALGALLYLLFFLVIITTNKEVTVRKTRGSDARMSG